jgi:23S rRNA (adenine2503-C2)-methyltransferase
MGCRFCRTATLGVRRQLGQAEILGQILQARPLIDSRLPLTNVVFMGMGEPLDNLRNLLSSLDILTSPEAMAFSPRRISVSTVGVAPAIRAISRLEARFPGGLTVSLGAPDDETRGSIIPANRRWPLAELKDALRGFPLVRGRRLTVAYVLLDGVNDSPAMAAGLSRFVTGLKTKINLIPFNPWPGAPFRRPDPGAVEAFRRVLVDKSHTVIVRRSNGLSVDAACGQLVGRHLPGPAAT